MVTSMDSGKVRLLLAGLVAVIAAIGAIAVYTRSSPAQGPGPAMSLACGQTVAEKCDVAVGAKFFIGVEATSPPANGYTTFQVLLNYSSNLVLQDKDVGALGEAKPVCLAGSETSTPPDDGPTGSYRIDCKVGSPPSHYNGLIVNVQFVCSPQAGSATVDLVAGTGAGVSVFFNPIDGVQFLKAGDSIKINCSQPTPTQTITPTFTLTPTLTSTSTSTVTQTPTPTVTPTETPSGKVKMALKVYSDAAKTNLVCGEGQPHRLCVVQAGSTFTVEVVASSPPAQGYTAWQAALQFSQTVSLHQQAGLSENKSPSANCFPGSETKGPGTYSINCKIGDPPTLPPYRGPLANVQFDCPPAGTYGQIDLIGGSGANVSAYVSPGIPSTLIFLKSSTKDGSGKQIADAVIFVCDSDFDHDGCTFVQETGPNPALGGQRNPKYFWDFYDVWTRPNPANQPNYWVRDKVVNILDILGVASRFGATRPGGAPTKAQALAEALVPPTSPDGYHADYDRGPLIGPNLWNLGPPDGAINIVNDVLGVANQFGHSCA